MATLVDVALRVVYAVGIKVQAQRAGLAAGIKDGIIRFAGLSGKIAERIIRICCYDLPSGKERHHVAVGVVEVGIGYLLRFSSTSPAPASLYTSRNRSGPPYTFLAVKVPSPSASMITCSPS